ncbi:MAG: hypothetical protein IPJ65_40960 [Archangiaceae bacterium]|nr:hypothetical protein [Archangiaceae bacterium]
MNRVIVVSMFSLAACGVPAASEASDSSSSLSGENELGPRDPCAGFDEKTCRSTQGCQAKYDLSQCPKCPPGAACSPCPPNLIKYASCYQVGPVAGSSDPCGVFTDLASCGQKSTCQWEGGTCPVCPPGTACAPCPESGRCVTQVATPPGPPPATK